MACRPDILGPTQQSLTSDLVTFHHHCCRLHHFRHYQHNLDHDNDGDDDDDDDHDKREANSAADAAIEAFGESS